MTPRIDNPANLLPDSMPGIQLIVEAAHRAGVAPATMQLVHLRASQINSCSACVYSGAVAAKKAGESDGRLFAVTAWRETDLFTEPERAALALAESMTRLADRADAVPDMVWDPAAEHFDDQQLAGLVLWVATTNLFNRINTATRQPAGAPW